MVPRAKIKKIKPYECFDFGEKFDIILANQVFEHIEKLDNIYHHLLEIMRPNGIIFCGFPTKEIIIEPHLKIPLIHRLNKESKTLEFFIKFFSFLKIGQIYKKGFNKKKYIEKRINLCKKDVFYHSVDDHLKLLGRYFSTVNEINDLWLNHIRKDRSYSNKIKFLIRLIPYKTLRSFLMRRIFGMYLLVTK